MKEAEKQENLKNVINSKERRVETVVGKCDES